MTQQSLGWISPNNILLRRALKTINTEDEIYIVQTGGMSIVCKYWDTGFKKEVRHI